MPGVPYVLLQNVLERLVSAPVPTIRSPFASVSTVKVTAPEVPPPARPEPATTELISPVDT